MERVTFYSVIRKGKIVGIAEQAGFEIKIDGEIFNVYRDEYENEVWGEREKRE